jgi:hypothetical protein
VFPQWTRTPCRQLCVQLGGGATDLSATLTSNPQSCSVMWATLRVLPPWTYISARANFSARSERSPFSKHLGANGSLLERTCGTRRANSPKRATKARSLNPLAWPSLFPRKDECF